ncbi:MAG: trimethylamine methyltransferase family protein [Bacillota bacterium]|jgi:trimethylamine--corrinoid protein Co-methyltransferase
MLSPASVLDEGQLEAISNTSLRILERVGVTVHEPEALSLLEKAGARVDWPRSRATIPHRLVSEALCQSSPVVSLYWRDGSRKLEVGGDNVYFGTIGFPTAVVDWSSGSYRLSPTSADLQEAVRVADMMENVDFIMPPASLSDCPAGRMDRHQWMISFLGSEKHIVNQTFGRQGAQAALAMARVLGGKAALSRPFLTFLVSVTSALTLRQDAAETILEGARAGVPLCIYSGPMAGATSPVTLAGTLAQGNAEALAGIVLAKVSNPGVPVIYGSWTRAMDMKYANVAFGSPEFALLRVASCQLAKHYGLPSAGGGILCDSKVPDAQFAYEKMMTALLPAMARMNMIVGMGLVGHENVLSLEGLVIDNEIAGYVRRALQGVSVDEERLAFDLIERLGPGGQFLAEDHTLRHFRQELWVPDLTNREGHVLWLQGGSRDIRDRARERIQECLSGWEAPRVPAGAVQEMARFL